MINDIDKEILKILQEDARTPNAEIARRLGMAPSAIFERIKKLEKLKIIQGYQATLDADALGFGLLAFIFIHTREPIGSSEIGQKLIKFPEVQEVHHITGEDCYLVRVRAANADHLWQFLKEKVGSLGPVNTRTTIVLETLKDTSHLPFEKKAKKR
ncbi:Lrp/AsnC family transcriptional regulator [Candidatus Acetothermia bacterium]|nr:Lrp/AsnC family transcriptional regulator [Candidatus Acetothermia bacterium]MBI3643716.1 Lrp/AsnC family transcriptional regulator [Candidatus Acetothermia bacterium]